MEAALQHTAESRAYRAALAENVGFVLESLEVVAFESLTSGDRAAAGFFSGLAALVGYFARTEGLGIEHDDTAVRTSSASWLVG